jgi:hypothetical protein
MALRNPDGSIYQPSGTLTQFNPNSTEHDLFNLWDQEVIQIGGTPLEYFDIFINVSSIDEIYMEARDKIFSPCPVCIYGYYDPIPSSNVLGTFGIDSPDEIMIEFNYRHVLKTLGFPPKIGARIYSPHKGENWQIIQRNVEVFKLWGELRLQVMCSRFQESLTTGEGKVTHTRKGADFKINTIKDLNKHKMDLAEGQPQLP